MVGTAVFGGWMANIDVSQASQGLAGGRSQRGQGLLGANEGWKQTREDAMSSTACRGWPPLSRDFSKVTEKYLESISFCAIN